MKNSKDEYLDMINDHREARALYQELVNLRNEVKILKSIVENIQDHIVIVQYDKGKEIQMPDNTNDIIKVFERYNHMLLPTVYSYDSNSKILYVDTWQEVAVVYTATSWIYGGRNE